MRRGRGRARASGAGTGTKTSGRGQRGRRGAAAPGAGTWTGAHPWDDGYAFTSPAGKFRANPWGLYDVHGNVWQWCADWYGKDYYLGGDNRDPAGPAEGTYRVIRGGSWTNEPKSARSAYRWRSDPNKEAFDNTGFRVVRVR